MISLASLFRPPPYNSMTAFSTPNGVPYKQQSPCNYTINTHHNTGSSHTPNLDANKYTSDLLQLDSCRINQLTKIPEAIPEIRTPLIAKSWEKALQSHSDTRFKDYVLTGITNELITGAYPSI